MEVGSIGRSGELERWSLLVFFFLNDRAPPEIHPLSLPDALPISRAGTALFLRDGATAVLGNRGRAGANLAARPDAPVIAEVARIDTDRGETGITALGPMVPA